jgi:translation initiation factor IF-2
MRVHELAKQLGTTSKELLDQLKARHIEAKNHMASLDEDVVKLFLEVKAAKSGAPRKIEPVVMTTKGRKTSTVKDAKKDAPAPVATPTSVKTPTPSPTLPGVKPVDHRHKTEKDAPATAPVHEPPTIEEVVLRPLEVAVPINIKDLAIRLNTRPGDIIKSLMMKFKIFANINQSLSEDLVREILREHGFALKVPETQEEVLTKSAAKIDKTKLKPRSPIVTFMGHVDHGKTSLLDAIRRTKVAESEHGGITQHIGAYEVKLPKGRIAFLDTPGHEAFTAMRARGANVTDIVVLVVAADDGVMPQTVEALDHARAAKVPIIVAMNKIDKPAAQANLDKLKRQLNELGLVPEDWGGKTITVGVSAKTGQGIDQLLDMILLEAEMLELKAIEDQEAVGVVVEAKLSKGRGPVATVLVQSGQLRVGDFVIAGYVSGRIKAMADSYRKPREVAGPSTPVEITGLSGVPEAGDKFFVTDEKKARVLVEQRQEELRRQRLEPAKKGHIHLEDLYKGIQEGSVRELNIILKADVQGSLEAIEDSLHKIGTEEVTILIMHKGVGNINSSDVVLAAASNAIIIGFHVDPDDQAREMAHKEDIDIRTYRVIYEIVNDMKAALEGMLAPKIKKTFVGRVEVKKVFNLSKSGKVAGSMVKKGKIMRNSAVVVLRNGQVVYEGKISALKRFKDDVKEVAEGFECGVSLANFEDIREGDVIDAFVLESVARKLE